MDQKFIKQYSELSAQIMSKLAKNKGSSNLFFSPYSIVMLLAIAANAASGETRDEIVEVLAGNSDYQQLMESIMQLRKSIEGKKALKSANAAIVKESYKENIVEGYAEQLKSFFDGSLFSCPDLVNAVNEWVKRQTDGLIEEVIKSVPESVVACLINAVLFDSAWKVKYEKYDIEDSVFTNADGSTTEIKMMSSEENEYLKDDNFIGFAKPYKGDYSFIGLLPRNEKNASIPVDVIKSLNIAELYRNRKFQEVSVGIPEFEETFEQDISELCKQMGIQKAFSLFADFSNLSKKEMFIGEIIHKAKIIVNRKGTKAAAVTLAEMEVGCMPYFKERIDLNRPFIYAVVHNKTGIPVFMGMVNSLRGEE